MKPKQPLTRSIIKDIYDECRLGNCSKWSDKIADILRANMWSEEILVDSSLLKEAWEEASGFQRSVLLNYFDIQEGPEDKVNSFLDILHVTRVSYDSLLPFDIPKSNSEQKINLLSILEHAYTFICDGWAPDFSDDAQKKYYIWLRYDIPRGRWVLSAAVGYFFFAFAGDGFYFETEHKAKRFFQIMEDQLNEFHNLTQRK